MNPRMFALEYGTTYDRFAFCCKSLVDGGDLVPMGPNRSQLKTFRVTEPENYEKHDERLGQRFEDRRWLVGTQLLDDRQLFDAYDEACEDTDWSEYDDQLEAED